jgi:hypothetical protein
MLETRKTIIAFEENDLIELERIIIESNVKDALRFLRKTVYEKEVHSQ